MGDEFNLKKANRSKHNLSKKNKDHNKKYNNHKLKNSSSNAAESSLRRDKPRSGDIDEEQMTSSAPGHSRPVPKIGPPNPVVVDTSNLKRETDDIQALNQKYARRHIVSTWKDTRNLDLPNYEDFEEKAADFQDLVSVSSKFFGGGHMMLKEEKSWLESDEQSSPFSLDVRQLAAGIACLPFYQRQSIDENKFSPKEIQTMNRESEDNAVIYRQLKMDSTPPDVKEQCKIISPILKPMEESSQYVSKSPPASIKTEPCNLLPSLSVCDTSNPLEPEVPIHLKREELRMDESTGQDLIVSLDQRRTNNDSSETDKVESTEKPDTTVLSTKTAELSISDILGSVDKLEVHDALGSASNLKVGAKKPETSVIVKRESKPKQRNNFDDDLDFILKLESPVSAVIPEKPSTPAVKSNSKKEVKEDTDDWLDNFLGS